MNDDTREQIALARFKLISPILAEPGRVQNEYFRKQAGKKHSFPHYGSRSVSISTFKLWLRRYRKQGFEGLKPKPRADRGRPRKLKQEHLAAIRAKCKAFPYWTARMLYESLKKDDQLGDPPIVYNTLLRVLKREGLLHHPKRTDVRKRYEVDQVNQLWVCDFMHGPRLRLEKRSAKAILCAIIDDHSRMIVGHAFNTSETICALTTVLKEAFVAYGLPKRLYVDNGPAFSSDLLTKSCALAGVSLIHSKPYDSPSRGKIERFFRTVRERFLPGLRTLESLDDLNHAFAIWLNDDYHHKLHSGIQQRPIDRYHASTARLEIRRLSRAELDHIFLVRHERVVNNDATISFKGRLWEVPSAYIRQRVEIRHPVDDDADLALYDNGARVAKLKLLDPHENARTFRPTKACDPFSFSDGRVRS